MTLQAMTVRFMGMAMEGAARSSEVTRGVRPSVSLTGEPVKLVPRTSESRTLVASSCEIHVLFSTIFKFQWTVVPQKSK